MDNNYSNAGVARKLPDAVRIELSEIRDGAKVGGSIPPRRREGLLVEYQRVETKYASKLENLRHFDSSGVAAAETAIIKIAAEFANSLPRAAAA